MLLAFTIASAFKPSEKAASYPYNDCLIGPATTE